MVNITLFFQRKLILLDWGRAVKKYEKTDDYVLKGRPLINTTLCDFDIFSVDVRKDI